MQERQREAVEQPSVGDGFARERERIKADSRQRFLEQQGVI